MTGIAEAPIFFDFFFSLIFFLPGIHDTHGLRYFLLFSIIFNDKWYTDKFHNGTESKPTSHMSAQGGSTNQMIESRTACIHMINRAIVAPESAEKFKAS